jgi:CRISPR-associated protein Cas2
MSTDTQLHLIAYDMSQDKVRTQLHKLLLAYGKWTQFSLFECHLTAKQSVKLVAEIKELLEEGCHVRIYIISKDDVAKTITLGGDPPAEDTIFMV